jgi:hypothetical protein
MKVYVSSSVNFNDACNKNHFLNKSKEGKKAYLCFNSAFPECKKKNIDLIKTSCFSEEDHENMLKEYVHIVGEMSVLNGRYREWLSTDFASKNRILSPMQNILNQIALSIKAFDKCKESNTSLYILGVDWPVIPFLVKLSKSKEISIEIENIFFTRLYFRLNNLKNTWMHLFKSTISSSLNIIKTRFVFGKIKVIDRNKPIFLIKSWVFSKSFSVDGKYNDPFCGNAALELKKHLNNNVQIVTISQGYKDKFKCYGMMGGIKDRIIFPVESFLKISDVILANFSIVWYLITKTIKVKNVNLFYGHDISPTLEEMAVSSMKFVRFSEYLYYYLGRRIAKRYILSGCLMSYEGNHWEKMFILGIKSVNTKVKIIGHHHSIISQAVAGVFISEREVGMEYNPDKIVTTGTASADVLKKYSCYNDENIITGCAFLYQHLHRYKILPRRNPPNVYTVLVMLEGVIETSSLLKYAINQAYDLPNVKFLVRAHPSFPLEMILTHMEVDLDNLPNNMIASNCANVLDDIKNCDVGLYWCTATSAEVLMMGRPIVWFDRGDVLNFDPLFDFHDFKYVVQESTPIVDTLLKINSLIDDEYKLKANKGREYISQYFEQCSDQNIKFFVKYCE